MENATTAEQVLVGRLSFPKANGGVSLFDLPKSFVWLKHFSAEEMAEFFSELLEALNMSQQDEDWSHVSELVGDWKETANIKADPEVASEIAEGLDELSRPDNHPSFEGKAQGLVALSVGRSANYLFDQ